MHTRVTVAFDGTDIRAVFTNVAELFGVSSVLGPGVEGPVYASVREQLRNEVLSALLDVYGLHGVDAGDELWRIETADRYLELEEYRRLVANRRGDSG
ncbi:MAG: hypothetical protein JSV41_09620 [Gemmatimonadota bacterium]|nr:MAG: hypothetical protein JSV41_09620 [Gemmatimonadota bacterium]